jgi:hypothetical protein
MRKVQDHKNQSEKGQSLVELALSFTILLMLLAGAIDFGRAFFTWVALRDAAQEGAAYGSIDPTNVTEIENRVYNILENSNAVPDPRSNVSITRTIIGQACLGYVIQIEVDYPTFPLTMPFLGTVIGRETLSIRANIQDTILRPTCGQ